HRKVRLLDQAITVKPGREAHIEKVSIYAEVTLPRFHADGCDPRGVCDDLTEVDAHIRGGAMQPDIARKKSEPTRHPDVEVPTIVVRDRGWRRLLRSVIRYRSGEKNWCGEQDRREKDLINKAAD